MRYLVTKMEKKERLTEISYTQRIRGDKRTERPQREREKEVD